jgi:hypothetical protein
VTVSVRWIPLVTAAYGTQVARPARTTRLAPGGDGLQLGQRARLVFGEHHLVAKSLEGASRHSARPRSYADGAGQVGVQPTAVDRE